MKISIISNDKRYITVNSMFLSDGYESKIETVKEFSGCDILILSVKNEYSGGELEEIFKKIGESTVIFKGSYIIPETENKVYNYAEDEEFVLKNAYLTAKGAIPLAQENSKCNIAVSRILILGYGRIGKYLAEMLKNMGAEVYAYARRECVREEAKKNKIIPCEFPLNLYKYDFVFNTIPEVIVPVKETEKAVAHGTTIIELASSPGGFEDKAFVIDGKGLPGKRLPTFAAQAVYETISKILSSTVAERKIL